MKITIKNPTTVVVFLFIFLSLLPSSVKAAYTTIQYDYNGGISTQTLTKDKSPYYILGGCTNNTLKSDKTITIEAGVVIKFADNKPCGIWGTVYTSISVLGNLIINGTPEEPIIFTSYHDDESGGDTNNDSNTTNPDPGDWGRIQINTTSGNISINNTIFKYGGGYSGSGMLSLTNSSITPTFDNLEFDHSISFGITSGIPFTIHNSSFHDNIQGAISRDNFNNPLIIAVNNWWGDDSGPTTLSNPNGKGQKIVGNILYDPWIRKTVKKEPVIIVPGMFGSQEKNGIWAIDPILHTYDNLFDTFKANGYVEGVDLFTFPYDWHQSNTLTAFQLHQKIDEIKSICNCNKVDIITHSMGGLATRQYVQSDYYENDIDQLIFLGTPHLGAPKAYLTWEAGEFQSTISDKVLYFLIKNEAKELGYNDIFDYIKHRPITSLEELLPIRDYLYDVNSGTMKVYPTDYPRNIFLEQLNDNQNLEKLYNSGVNITNIVGDVGATSTINTIRVVDSSLLPLWQHGFPEGFNDWFGDHGLELGSGDETVPTFSASFISNNIEQINGAHVKLPTIAQTRIYKILNNSLPQTVVIDKAKIDLRFLIIRILSPADIIVIAPDGKRVGKDFLTDQEVNEIDGSFYSGFSTDNEYITIPNPIDGEYKVMTQGTGSGGAYTVAVGYIGDGVYVDKDIKGNILPDMITTIDVNVDNVKPENLGLNPEDRTPPTIVIVSPEERDYFRQDKITFNASIVDIGSGLFSQKLLFDDKIVNNNDTIDLFTTPLGNHIFTVVAEDYQGNIATSTVDFRNIVTLESVMGDVQKMYDFGWISAKSTKKHLLDTLKKIIEISKDENEEEGEHDDKEKTEEKEENKIIKIINNKFLKEIKKRLNISIDEQAYNLLLEDIVWLLNNLK